MINLFIILCCLAGYHLMYESVILPTIRMSVRYKIFKVRDRLRAEKIKKGDELDDSVYRIVEDNLNNALFFLPN